MAKSVKDLKRAVEALDIFRAASKQADFWPDGETGFWTDEKTERPPADESWYKNQKAAMEAEISRRKMDALKK